ncbi:MAG: hypothetical protein RLZZ210_360, partial [Pseudomonadota bacterium]
TDKENVITNNKDNSKTKHKPSSNIHVSNKSKIIDYPSKISNQSSNDSSKNLNGAIVKDWNSYGNLFYKVLSSEFISQNSPTQIFDTYISLATNLKEPKLAERATQIAIDAGDFKRAKQASQIWGQYVKDEQKFHYYRTLSYLSVQLKDYSKLAEYIGLWLDSVPKDTKTDLSKNKKDEKFITEINNLPNIITINDPVVINDIADKIISYKLLEARLVGAKLLIRAKQNKGLDVIKVLKDENPLNEDIFFTWLSALPAEKQIEELKDYIQKAKSAEQKIKQTKDNKENKDSNNLTEVDSQDSDKENVSEQGYNLKRANFSLMGILFASGDFKTGIEFGTALVADYPQDLEYSFLLAQMHRVQKDYKSSYIIMTNLFEHHKKLPITMYLFLADISKEMKNYKLAAYWLEQTSATDIAIIKDIASLYLQANEYEKAYIYYNKMRASLNDEEKLVKFDMLSLKLWVAAMQWSYALEIINRMIDKNPKSAELYSLRSDIYLFTDDLDKAELDLIKIISLDTENVNALNSLAYIYAQKSVKLDLALEYIKKAVDKESENYAYQDTMGWVLFKQGKFEQARKWLEQSWNTQPDAETGNHLGEVLWQMGERDQAKIIWELAKKIDSTEKIQQELQNNLNRK